VSGDDGGEVRLLTPTGSFSYSEQQLIAETGTIGTMAAADFNGNFFGFGHSVFVGFALESIVTSKICARKNTSFY
jgi:hypothetical protein